MPIATIISPLCGLDKLLLEDVMISVIEARQKKITRCHYLDRIDAKTLQIKVLELFANNISFSPTHFK